MTHKSLDQQPKTAFVAGSFNPFTVGHKSLVDRALCLFDKVVVGIGVNAGKEVDTQLLERRQQAIKRCYADDPRVEVTIYTGLTVDACRAANANWLVRGVRSVADFEYERSLADINRSISGIETVILFTLPEHSAISSSVVRELQRYDCDVSPFIP